MKVFQRNASLMIGISFAILITCTLNLAILGQAQDPRVALQRGYRTGYSDGYMAGYRDSIDSMNKEYSRHAEYGRADRAFNADYGQKEDYRDGYQQGFESGYETGFEKRSFESTLPTNLKRRGATTPLAQMAQTSYDPTPANSSDSTSVKPSTGQNNDQYYSNANIPANSTVLIPRDTEFILELDNDISTDTSKEGERFTARIISPNEISGATVEGRIAKIRKPGKIKRRSEILLSFDRINIGNSRWSNFSATLTEVMPIKGDNIKLVDNEGTAIGNSSLKKDAIKVGAATGTGLVIGAIAGGPVGAAVGAGVGAAFGVGAVVIERRNHIRINRSQQLRIKTNCEVQIH